MKGFQELMRSRAEKTPPAGVLPRGSVFCVSAVTSTSLWCQLNSPCREAPGHEGAPTAGHSSLLARLALCPGAATASAAPGQLTPKRPHPSCRGQQEPPEPACSSGNGSHLSSPRNPHPFHEDRDLGVAGTAAAALNTKGNAPSHRAK